MWKVSAVLALLIVTTGALVHAPSRPRAHASNDGRDAGLNQLELNEDDALDRFEIDELFLPRLNVELPALFQWSARQSAYLA